jgi:hypothetical protein
VVVVVVVVVVVFWYYFPKHLAFSEIYGGRIQKMSLLINN